MSDMRRLPGSLDRLASLGPTPLDQALLRSALRQLDRDHGLATKIASQPSLGRIIAEFERRLLDAFGSLSPVAGLRILDIASGSNSSRSPVSGRESVEFEPWMCRLLQALGARPVAVDIGDLDGEIFEHHRVDLGVMGALDFLAAGSFDAIHESRLFGSPEFRETHGRDAERVRAELHRQEQRLLRPGGTLIHRD
jgi:hypothetical protein